MMHLDTGHVCGEFYTASLPDVLKALEAFGSVVLNQIADASIIDAGGENLVLTDE